MNNYPQDNFVPDHHICTHTEKSKLTEKTSFSLRVSLWFYSVLVQSSVQQPLKNKAQLFRIWFCLVPKFKSWSHQDSPELPQESEKFCFVQVLSPNLGLGIPVKNSNSEFNSFGFYTQQETNLWKLISASGCPFFSFFQGEIGAKNLVVLYQDALFYVLLKLFANVREYLPSKWGRTKN